MKSLTSRSKRIRSETPKAVENRNTVGWNSAEADARISFSACTLLSEYVDSGCSGAVSSTSASGLETP